MRRLLSGNEAIALGAWEAGVHFATGYPGTPSTEILETISAYDDIDSSWAMNEKVALDMALGVSLAGKRALVTMKHVGLNVASDTFMVIPYSGCIGGIVYRGEERPDLRAYAQIVREATAGLDAELSFEPGRLLVGNAGVLLTRVIYLKEGSSRRYAIVDAAMNDLIRPMLYEAWHEILPARAPVPGTDPAPVDIVGPICETTDTFARGRPLPPLAAGDLLTIYSAGAYSAVMSSSYNARLPAPEVLVRGDRFAVVRPRLDHEDLIAQDRIPDWLEGESPRRVTRSGRT